MTAGPAAIIFDLDDTLAATGAVWARAERAVLARVGHELTAALAAQYKGMNARDVAATMHRVLGLATPLGELQQALRRELLAAFAAGPTPAVPGAVALVRRLEGLAPLVVASGSPLPAIELALTRLDLRASMAHLVSSEAVPRGKPHPDVFLAAARMIGAGGVAPQSCVVFEDSLIGAQAARAAGMACFVRPSLPGPELAAVATRVVASWDEVTAAEVRAAGRFERQKS